MADTQIEWCEQTWNPITGCTPISEGCEHCYAMRLLKGRLRGRHGVDAKHPTRPTFHPHRLAKIPGGKGRIVFVCSMGDLFHRDVCWTWVDAVWDAMRLWQHTFVILTKRPGRMYAYMHRRMDCLKGLDVPFPNVWLGVSVENQARADERIPMLLSIPAAKHIVSYEPALGPMDPREVRVGNGDAFCPLSHNKAGDEVSHKGIDWLICGGETGSGSRPMHPDWARSARDACVAAGVPFFFKHWGRRPNAIPGDLPRVLDGREWNQRPEQC